MLSFSEAPTPKGKWNGSSDHLQYVDLSDNFINSPIIERQYMPEYSETKIYISIDGIKYGFIDSEYVNFYKFIYKISLWNSLYKTVSIEYLKEKTLYWIIDIYKNKKTKSDLLPFIESCLNTDIKKIKYYFPILNLDIEKSFKIGDVEFTFFTKEFFDEFWDKKSKEMNTSEESFNSLFRKYQGQVFVLSEVEAEESKAQELAYDNVCLATDIIKLLSPTVYFPNEKCNIELESRLPFSFEHLSIESDKKFDFKISVQTNRGTFVIKNEMIEGIRENMLKLFGYLLTKNEKSDLERKIISSIQFYSRCMMENDLHLRVSHLIMITESIFLLDEETYKMENKCKKRMCQLIYRNDKKLRQSLYDCLTDMYEIRHKMTHKSIKNFIEIEKLRLLQTSIVDVFLILLDNVKGLKNKEALILNIDEEIKANT